MAVEYLLLAGFAAFGLGLAGMLSGRNIITILLSAEAAFAGSIIALVYFMGSNAVQGWDAVGILYGIWSVAAVEAIVLVVFYMHVKKKGLDFDIDRLRHRGGKQ